MYKNLDSYIDTKKFLSFSREICLGISQSERGLCNPGSRTIGIEGYPNLKHPFESEPKFLEQDSKYVKSLTTTQYRDYFKYYYKVHYPVESIFLKTSNGYKNKHTSVGAKYTNNAKYFPSLMKWIEEETPFKEVGKIQFFILNSFAKLTSHRDSMDFDYTNKPSDMLWFTIDKNAMSFWIKNENKKYYPDCTCAWFNENLEHGSDGVPDATFCFRIDGTFKEDWDALHIIYGH